MAHPRNENGRLNFVCDVLDFARHVLTFRAGYIWSYWFGRFRKFDRDGIFHRYDWCNFGVGDNIRPNRTECVVRRGGIAIFGRCRRNYYVGINIRANGLILEIIVGGV